MSKFIYRILMSSLCYIFLTSNAYAKLDSEIYTVRYSYEKQNQSGKKRYVLIPKVEQLSKGTYEDFNKRSRALFNLLKGDKSKNYGKVRFATKGKVVFIYLDKKKIKNTSFIMSETVYTFTANGADGVKFPKSSLQDKLYTRSDVQYPAYQLTLPYWEGLPPTKIKSSLLSFPDGNFATSTALEESLEKNDPKLIHYFRQSFKNEDLPAVRAITNALNLYPIKNIEKALLPALKSKVAEVRMLAIKGMKSVDNTEVNQALRMIMDEDKDSAIQDLAAEQLSQSKDKDVADFASFHALKSKDEAIAITAAKALQKSTSKETNQALAKVLNHENKRVAEVVIDTLVQRKAFKELLQVLKGKFSVERQIQVAEALVTIPKAKNEAYLFLVNQPQAEAVIRVCNTLVKDRKYKNSLDILSKVLTHPDAEARIAAAQAFVKLNDKKSLKLLANGNIKDPKSGAALHQAMRDLYKMQKDTVILNESARAKNSALKSAATGTLGVVFQRAKSEKFKRKAFKACTQLSQSKEAIIRAEAVRCFGDIGTKFAKDQILKLMDDTAVEVQRMLFFSLRNFKADTAKSFLMKGLTDKDPISLRNVIDTLSLLKVEETFEKIKEPVLRQHDSAIVRSMVMQALGRFALIVKKGKVGGIVPLLDQTLAKDTDLTVRKNAALSLGNIKSSDATFSLSAQLLAGNLELTLSIIKALAKQDTKDAASSLKAAMENSSYDIREAAYLETTHFKNAEAIKELKKILTKRKTKEKSKELLKIIDQKLAKL